MKILLISGSLRAKSFNSQMADIARTILEKEPGVEVSILDWKNVPIFSQDDEVPVLGPVQQCRDAISSADALWFFTPEYNGQIPGGLKNMLDWMSRAIDPSNYLSSVIRGKYAAISGAGGAAAAGGSRALLEKLLKFMGLKVYSEQVGIALSKPEFASDTFTDPKRIEAELEKQAKGYLAWIAESQAK